MIAFCYRWLESLSFVAGNLSSCLWFNFRVHFHIIFILCGVGLPLERDHFMMLLYKLEGVFIRANYWSSSFEAR